MIDKPFRIIATFNGNPVYMRTFPTHVDLVLNGEHKQFPNYESALLFLQTITKRNGCRERKEHGFITSQSEYIGCTQQAKKRKQ